MKWLRSRKPATSRSTVKGVPATQSSAFRNIVAERYPTYNLTALNATDYQMKLKPTELISMEADTVQRSIDTISNRIDQLGLAEKSVQQYGRSGSRFPDPGAIARRRRSGARSGN